MKYTGNKNKESTGLITPQLLKDILKNFRAQVFSGSEYLSESNEAFCRRTDGSQHNYPQTFCQSSLWTGVGVWAVS